MPNWPHSDLNYRRFEEFILIAEKVMQTFYARRNIPHNKIVPD